LRFNLLVLLLCDSCRHKNGGALLFKKLLSNSNTLDAYRLR
jgi:hypothetical protein